MNNYSPDFRLEVEGVKGFCPAGEQYAHFLMDDVSEDERKAVAWQVADAIISIVKRDAFAGRREAQPAAKSGLS